MCRPCLCPGRSPKEAAASARRAAAGGPRPPIVTTTLPGMTIAVRPQPGCRWGAGCATGRGWPAPGVDSPGLVPETDWTAAHDARTGAISCTAKKRIMDAILAWMPERPEIPAGMLGAKSPGFCHPGQLVTTPRHAANLADPVGAAEPVE